MSEPLTDNSDMAKVETNDEQKSVCCDQCDFKTVWKKALKDHKITHLDAGEKAKLKLKCDECSFSTVWKSYLKQHKKMHSSNIYSCSFCSFESKWHSSLISHSRIHSNEKKSAVENWSHIKSELKEKNSVHVANTFNCDTCGITLASNWSLENHQTTHTGLKKSHECEQCSKSYSDSGSLGKHKRKIHSEGKEQHVGTAFVCDTCGKTLASKRSLENHQATHSGLKKYDGETIGHVESDHIEETSVCVVKTFFCDTCGKTLASKWSLENHQSQHTGLKMWYTCKQCSKSYSDRGSLSRHRRKIHLGIEDQQIPTCHICYFECTSKEEKDKHMVDVHDVGKIDRFTQEFKIDAVKKVDIVGLIKASKELHINSSTLQEWVLLIKKPFYCLFCSKPFAYERKLKLHEKKHQQEKEDTPRKKSKGRKNYIPRLTDTNDHKRYQEKRAYQCDKCPKSYGNPYKLKYHMQCCSGSTTLQSPSTDQEFIQKVILLALKTNVINSCREFKLSDSTVRGWIKQYYNPEKYGCETCQKLCNTKAHLRKHMETHTRNNNKNTDSTKKWSKDFIEEAVHLARETSLEESCRVNDVSKRVLTRWIKLIERPVKCDICTKQFAYKSEWNNHMQAHHSQDNGVELTDKQDLRQRYLQRYNSDSDFHDNLEEIHDPPDKETENTDLEVGTLKDTECRYLTNNEDGLAQDENQSEIHIDILDNIDSADVQIDRIDGVELNHDENNEIILENMQNNHLKNIENQPKVNNNILDKIDSRDVEIEKADYVELKLEENNQINLKTLGDKYLKINENGLIQDENQSDISDNIESGNNESDKVDDVEFKLEENNETAIQTETLKYEEGIDYHKIENEVKDENIDEGEVVNTYATEKIKTEIKDSSEVGTINTTCNICFKKFKSKGDRNKHVRFVHENEKNFGCQFCSKKFSRQVQVTIHERIHTGEKPYQCETCGKSFIDKAEIKRHVEYTHGSGIKFYCDECGLDLCRKDVLKTHKMNVHGIGNISSFLCDHCSQTFNTKAHLTAHMKVHSDEIFPCTICDKVFNLKVKLKRHELRHENLKQFGCNICDKQFAEKRSLKTHISVLHAGERSFKCNKCEKDFTRYTSLVAHQLVHTNMKSFQCQVCGQEFKEKRNLNKHSQNKHN